MTKYLIPFSHLVLILFMAWVVFAPIAFLPSFRGPASIDTDDGLSRVRGVVVEK